jgi:hypothetical protein
VSEQKRGQVIDLSGKFVPIKTFAAALFGSSTVDQNVKTSHTLCHTLCKLPNRLKGFKLQVPHVNSTFTGLVHMNLVALSTAKQTGLCKP